VYKGVMYLVRVQRLQARVTKVLVRVLKMRTRVRTSLV